MVANSPSPGKLVVLLTSGLALKSVSLGDDQSLAELVFRVTDLATEGQSCPLTFTEVTKLVDDRGNVLPSATDDGKLTVDSAFVPLFVEGAEASTAGATVRFSAPVNAAEAADPRRYLVDSPLGAAPVHPLAATYDDATRSASLTGLELYAGEVCRITVLGVRDQYGNALPDDGETNVARPTVGGAASSTVLGSQWNLAGLPLQPLDPTSSAARRK